MIKGFIKTHVIINKYNKMNNIIINTIEINILTRTQYFNIIFLGAVSQKLLGSIQSKSSKTKAVLQL